jgi:uncharacterized protein YgbK (DUF1537 family)
MIQLVIIADDLTGAADTGVQFCPYFRDTILVPFGNLLPDAFPFASEALAVYTNSRPLAAERAWERVRHIARRLLALNPKFLYKKVDSCLRGNIGAEVDAVMDEMGFELSFIAPAFPEMGRTTIHDVHLLDGIPIAQTELSRDPVTPVTESRLSSVVAAKSRYQVAHVDVEFLDPGDDDALGAEIFRLSRLGARHLVFDAESQVQLDMIARLAGTLSKKTLLVGSAGLAESLGKQFPKKASGNELDALMISGGKHLLVCGTVSERTKQQISTLLETYPYQVITLRPGLLADSTRRDELLAQALSAQALLSDNHVIIRVEDTETVEAGFDQGPRPWTAEGLVGGLGAFVAEVLKEKHPAGLFLSGGDTADAVLRNMGATGIRLIGEIVPGMVQGRLWGGLVDNLPVVTKAGAFGKKDTLVDLHEYWANRAKENRDDL